MDTARRWLKIFALTIVFFLMGCGTTAAVSDDGCYAEILLHKESLVWDLYFWDVDCDNVCDGAVLELKAPSKGQLGFVPLTCEQGWIFWDYYLNEQRRMGA